MKAIERVRQAQFAGMRDAEIKPLYLEQNTFDIGIDEPIYRIFQLKHLKADISRKTLTHIRVRPESWGSQYENPLLSATFKDLQTGGNITLKNLLGDYYALSWTKSANESRGAWSKFSHSKPAVRVESTPRLLLDHLMCVQDQWFMLRHFVGLVLYEDKTTIDAWISDPDYSKHLDSLGHTLAQSLMLLPRDFKSEEEVRLLFTLLRNSPTKWLKNNVKCKDTTCQIPFEWCGAIKSIVFGPMINRDQEESFNRLLTKEGIQPARGGPI